jgi:hypothetical protein
MTSLPSTSGEPSTFPPSLRILVALMYQHTADSVDSRGNRAGGMVALNSVAVLHIAA